MVSPRSAVSVQNEAELLFGKVAGIITKEGKPLQQAQLQ
jgi:hypothetical protein